jgi:uncharacterized membrane protein (DUF373 family)
MSMKNPQWMAALGAHFERAAIVVLQLLLMVVIAMAIFEMSVLVFEGIADRFANNKGVVAAVDTVSDLQRVVQRAFGGVLLIILGLELLETLRTYFVEHRIRLEIILIVAIIAVGRHIIQLDFEHVSGVTLLGIGALMLALAGGYFLVKRSMASVS